MVDNDWVLKRTALSEAGTPGGGTFASSQHFFCFVRHSKCLSYFSMSFFKVLVKRIYGINFISLASGVRNAEELRKYYLQRKLLLISLTPSLSF